MAYAPTASPSPRTPRLPRRCRAATVLWASLAVGFLIGYSAAVAVIVTLCQPFLELLRPPCCHVPPARPAAAAAVPGALASVPAATAAAAWAAVSNAVVTRRMHVMWASKYAGAAACLPAAAWVSRACGRKASLIAGLAAFLAGLALFVSAQNYAQLLASQVLLGAADAALIMAVALQEIEVAPPQRRGAYGAVVVLGWAMGHTAGFVAACPPALRNARVGWRLAAAMAGMPALLAMPLAVLMPETPQSLLQRGQVRHAARMP